MNRRESNKLGQVGERARRALQNPVTSLAFIQYDMVNHFLKEEDRHDLTDL